MSVRDVVGNRIARHFRAWRIGTPGNAIPLPLSQSFFDTEEFSGIRPPQIANHLVCQPQALREEDQEEQGSNKLWLAKTFASEKSAHHQKRVFYHGEVLY
jgi:hypothetical protein